MSTLANYKVINTSLGTYIKKANIALVKKKSWEVTKDKIPGLLADYTASEIKLGKLETSVGSENKYKLSLDGPINYNLIVFISNDFTLNTPNTSRASYVGLGAVEIPEIGLPDTQTYLNITFNEIDSLVDPDSITIDPSISIDAEITNYEKDALGPELGILDYETAEIMFQPTSRPELNSSYGLSFAPGGLVYESTFVKEQKLNLDLTPFGTLLKSTSIVHRNNEYIRLENTQGDLVLKNLYREDSGPVTLIPSDWNVVVIKEPNYSCLLNPDFLVITNLVNKVSYKYSTVSYNLNRYSKISDIPMDELIQLKRSLKFGTDLDSTYISTIFSDTSKKENWFLQSSHTNIFKNNPVINVRKAPS